MKTMCPPGFHHSGFVATHALGHMMYDDNHCCYQPLISSGQILLSLTVWL